MRSRADHGCVESLGTEPFLRPIGASRWSASGPSTSLHSPRQWPPARRHRICSIIDGRLLVAAKGADAVLVRRGCIGCAAQRERDRSDRLLENSPDDRTMSNSSAITKSYRGTPAVRDVTLDFREAEIHALLGENGAGKSTLTKIVAGRGCSRTLRHPAGARQARARFRQRPSEALGSGHRHGVPGDLACAVHDGRSEPVPRQPKARSIACAASRSRPSSFCNPSTSRWTRPRWSRALGSGQEADGGDCEGGPAQRPADHLRRADRNPDAGRKAALLRARCAACRRAG